MTAQDFLCKAPANLGGELFHLLHPRQNWRGYGLVVRVDGENFRHVALLLEVQHHRAMAFLLTVLAKLVAQSHIRREHVALHSRIQLGSCENDRNFGRFETRKVRPCCLSCRIHRLGSPSTATSATPSLHATRTADGAFGGVW